MPYVKGIGEEQRSIADFIKSASRRRNVCDIRKFECWLVEIVVDEA